MKIKLEISEEDPADRENMILYLNAPAMYSVFCKAREDLRRFVKDAECLSPVEQDLLEDIISDLYIDGVD